MKPLRVLSITLLLTLLINNAPIVARSHLQSAQSQMDSIRTYQVTGLLNVQNRGNNEVERLYFNDSQEPSHNIVTNLSEPPALSAFQSSESGGWHFECIECTKQFYGGTNHNLQLDGNENPHVVYGGDHLYHAWRDGQGWHYETVDNAIGVGGYASLAIDAADHLHVSYYDRANGGLKYAYWNGSAWQIQTVDIGSKGNMTSIAVDSQGHPHISYVRNSGYDYLMYAYWTGSVWRIQTIEALGLLGYFTTIALDASDRPHLVYLVWINDYENIAYLKYAYWTGSNWEVHLVGDGPLIGNYASLALDSSGLPHISFQDWSSNYSLKYAHWTGSTWILQTVDGEERSGYGSSIKLDANGTPHISYTSQDGGLKLASGSGGVWTIENVDATGSYGTSLALDASQHPRISYFTYHGGTDNELKYARWTGSVWDIEPIDQEKSPGEASSLAVDAAGHAHISLTRDGLEYIHWDGSAWFTHTIDAAGSNGSLVLDSVGYPHISYFDAIHNELKYAYWTGSLWVTQTVTNSVADTYGVVYPIMALSADGTPHIIYYDFVDDYLKYAHWTGSSWNIQSVEKGIDLGSAPGIHSFSLALDSMGYPHITYLTENTLNLRYARWTGTVWNIQTIATYIHYGNTSLALDVANSPHLCFQDDGLKYAHWTGSAWNIQTLDNEYNAGSGCSLALDVAGNPRISYLGRDFGSMKYARRMNDTWTIQMVDNLGTGDGNGRDLALDTTGNPHITYFNTGDNDIYYARLLSPLAIDQVATPRDGLSNSDTLTVTLTLFGPGVNARLWNPLPANVEYVPGSVTAPAVYSSTAKAIVWQGTLPTETVQVIQFQITPSATIGGEQSLSPVIINTAWLLDTEYNRTVSAMTIVNGWYRYLPLVRH